MGDVMKTKPWVMLVAMLAGWLNRQQQEAMNYLMEENKILKHELLKATGKKRIILNDRRLSGTFFNHLRWGIYFKVTWQFGFKSHKLAGGWVT